MHKKMQKLSIFLFKEDVTSFNQCVSASDTYQVYDLLPQLNLEGKIILGQKSEETPTWANFLNTGASTTLDYNQLINTSSRAVLILKIEDRFLGISFGFGRFLLDDDHIEKTFGLRVVLNLVNPQKIKTVELATLSDNTIITKRQSTRNTAKEMFGVDIINNLICAVSGRPNNGNSLLGKVVSGREQLIISPKVDFTNMQEVLKEVLNAYKSSTYKDEFDWIDDILPVKDKGVVEKLDQELIQSLIQNKFDVLDMSVPEIEDSGIIDGYSFIKSGEIFSEPELIEFLSTVDNLEKLDVKFLKYRRLLISDAFSSTKIPKWRIYDCLNFQTTYDGNFYVLFGGQWYCVDNQFFNKIITKIDKIINPNTFYFNCSTTWKREEEFNYAFAHSDTSKFVLLDKKLIKCEGARTSIEPCDVFSSDGTFYHIKPKKASSSLSHLFVQAKISGESFLKDQQFRKSLRRILKQRGSIEHLHLIPTIKRPTASDYKIVFGIIDTSIKPLNESLPFFSQLNLVLAYDHLSMLGYKVSAVKIQKQ